jgi:hypothetical protein
VTVKANPWWWYFTHHGFYPEKQKLVGGSSVKAAWRRDGGLEAGECQRERDFCGFNFV